MGLPQSHLVNDPAYLAYQQERRSHWDAVCNLRKNWQGLGNYYHRRLEQIYQNLIPPGLRVLELGCGNGDLLASLKPSYGVGIDFASSMLTEARQRFPQLTFLEADVHEIEMSGPFDMIILSDTINDLWDVQTVFEHMRALCTPSTRILLNYYSRLWEQPLRLARSLRLATPNLFQNWLTPADTANLLNLANFEVIRTWDEIMFPFNIPLIAPLMNRYLVRMWPFYHLALTHMTLARPIFCSNENEAQPVVSVLVPARNEAGNVPEIFRRVPEMGAGTELIFVEGNSTDDTYSVIEEAIQHNPQRNAVLLRQPGKGKGDAVRAGFERANGDILMILDADLTVPPEDLPRFCQALISGKGDFINGVRLVYPMEKDAMRFFNLLGNKFFSLLFSWLLGQPVKDTLCGTKVLWKRDYDRITANRAYFGDFDPFGDFDLLFGAARLNFKIIDMPVRYRERTYGTTNIQRWKHGWLLLRMVAFAARRIKFI